MSEFNDDDFFSELEAMLVILGPRECVLPRDDGEFARIKTLLERNSVMITVMKKGDFSTDMGNVVQDLDKLLHFAEGHKGSANALPEVVNVLAMSSLAAALKYLGLMEDACNLGHFEMKLLNLNRYFIYLYTQLFSFYLLLCILFSFVHLDAAAVSALNLLPRPGTQVNSAAYKWQSILGVLDRCRTPQGHRLMAQWVKQPLRNEEIIRDRHNVVQCFVDASCTRDSLYDNYLKKIPDIMVWLKILFV